MADEFIPHITICSAVSRQMSRRLLLRKRCILLIRMNKYDAFLHVLIGRKSSELYDFLRNKGDDKCSVSEDAQAADLLRHAARGDGAEGKAEDCGRFSARGCFRFLIATDVAARGVDFEQITHVVNYDFPTGKETYVHQDRKDGEKRKMRYCSQPGYRRRQEDAEAGGGVCGAEPAAVRSFRCRMLKRKRYFWKSQRIKAEIMPKKGTALNKGIIRLSIGGGRKSKMRAGDIVGTDMRY